MPKQGSRHERGYGYEHTKLREAWAPTVAAGEAHCHARHCRMPNRWIRPGTPWDLGHTPDRTAYTGPEHRRCNRRDGALRGNARKAARRANRPQSQEW